MSLCRYTTTALDGSELHYYEATDVDYELATLQTQLTAMQRRAEAAEGNVDRIKRLVKLLVPDDDPRADERDAVLNMICIVSTPPGVERPAGE